MKLRLAIISLFIFALASCGGEDLAVINLSGAASSGGNTKLAAQESCLPGLECADAMYVSTEFVYEAGVTTWPELGGSQPSWRLKKHKATDADLIRIADVFDVSGDISSFSYDKNSRFIGAEDYSKPTVTTYYDGISSSWNYSASTDITKARAANQVQALRIRRARQALRALPLQRSSHRSHRRMFQQRVKRQLCQSSTCRVSVSTPQS